MKSEKNKNIIIGLDTSCYTTSIAAITFNKEIVLNEKIILKVKKDELEEVKDEKLNKIVRTRIISVEEKMHYVRDIMKEKENIRFTNLIDTYEKDEIIATFLSVLELIKTNEIMVVQDLFFEDILIKRNMES